METTKTQTCRAYNCREKTANESGYCDYCYNDRFSECAACSRVVYREDMWNHLCSDCYNYCDACDTYYEPQNCCNCDEHDVDSIMDYGCKAPDYLDFLGNPKDKMYFGVELEVESVYGDASTQARKVRSLLPNFVITKYDGSLNDGFEIVTAPASLEEHYKRWPNFFNNLEKLSLRSFNTDTCGMHVHISRKALLPSQLGRMIVFMHEPTNLKFLERMAQRSLHKGKGAAYASTAGKYKLTQIVHVSDEAPYGFVYQRGVKKLDKRQIIEKRFNIGRGAINCDNPDTIEIRIFKGTLSKAGFFANLEFVRALVDFCKPGVCGLNELSTPDAFKAYVFKYRKFYKHLAARILDWDKRDAERKEKSKSA